MTNLPRSNPKRMQRRKTNFPITNIFVMRFLISKGKNEYLFDKQVYKYQQLVYLELIKKKQIIRCDRQRYEY